MTDNAIQMVLDDPGVSAPDLCAAAGTPIAGGDPRQTLVLVAVHDVRLLPDGRTMAIVWWATADDPADVSEVNIHLYRQIDGRWLLDEEITP
jgi:hypothetical protein